jgi:hypothetical protein
VRSILVFCTSIALSVNCLAAAATGNATLVIRADQGTETINRSPTEHIDA